MAFINLCFNFLHDVYVICPRHGLSRSKIKDIKCLFANLNDIKKLT